MKRFNIIHTFLCLVLIIAAGCKKDLDLSPKDQLSDASFWKTPKDFELAANDFYYGLRQASENIDNNSDIAFGSGANPVSNGSYLAPSISPVWDNSYKQIRSTNYLLQKAGESELGEAIDHSVGAALFFRAYNYWNLVSRFGGVPKIEKVLDVTSPELYSPKSTQEEIFDFILADLKEAATKLPLQSELSEDDMGKVTRGAALALRARAALYMGTWAKYHGTGDAPKYLAAAVESAEEVVASREYQLYTDKGADSYKHLFILSGDDSKEVILARRYYANRATHNWTRELWFNAMTPTKNLADLYLATDGRPISQSPRFAGYNTLTSEFTNRDPRMSMTFVVPGSTIFFEGGILQPKFPGFSGSDATHTGYMLRKFLDETEDAATFRGAYDIKEFRYGEVLLILAEALFESSGQITDADLSRTINLLRSRVNMPPLTNAHVAQYGLNMLEELRRERTVELAFEGFRRDDLKRWKAAETVMIQPLRGVKFVGTEYQQRYPNLSIGTDIQVDTQGFILAEQGSSRRFLPKHYFDPIPLQQIQLSKGNLTQNAGW